MDCYFAPMEGITSYVYRNAHHQFFGWVDRYFSPFLTPNQTRRLTARELRDVRPENNRGTPLVPQVLTNREEDFLWAARQLQEMGYEEVNLNLGCPSGTVVSKGRGAGFLGHPDQLKLFLQQVSREMERMGMALSVKTRLGRWSREEFSQLLSIYNEFPIQYVVIHPRIREDYYKNQPDLESFAMALKESRHPVCYNGDVFSLEDAERLRQRFPQVTCLMAGRGMLANPALAGQIKGKSGRADKSTWRSFHDAVLEGYREAIPGDRNVLFKMKELWSYFGFGFDSCEKPLKRIRKAARMEEYMAAADQLFSSCRLKEHPVYKETGL